MYHSVYDLKNFYASRPGRLVRRIIGGHIGEIWEDCSGLRMMGFGYALPYLRPYMGNAERVFHVMPEPFGVHHWPQNHKNLTCLSESSELPVETESVDRILVVHGLEHSEDPVPCMQELWRVLKSNGRILMIVPNRLGLWARAEWTPFGLGKPFSVTQVNHLLKESFFEHERLERGLFMPPFRSFFMLRTAYMMEGMGRYVFPGLAGVLVVEAGKQVYAGIGSGKERAGARRRVVIPKPAMQGARADRKI